MGTLDTNLADRARWAPVVEPLSAHFTLHLMDPAGFAEQVVAFLG